MTRAEQDAILIPVVAAYAYVLAGPRHLPTDEPASIRTLLSFRASLRLDDKRLDHAIAWGAHKQPWQSAVPAKIDG